MSLWSDTVPAQVGQESFSSWKFAEHRVQTLINSYCSSVVYSQYYKVSVKGPVRFPPIKLDLVRLEYQYSPGLCVCPVQWTSSSLPTTACSLFTNRCFFLQGLLEETGHQLVPAPTCELTRVLTRLLGEHAGIMAVAVIIGKGFLPPCLGHKGCYLC